MPSIITLAHQKGGVGKSTTALNLYGYFSKAGLKTAIVDIDPQGSLSGFVQFSGAENFNLIRREEFKTYAELLQQVKDYEVVIIDTPPYLSDELEEVIKITNLVIIPCKASLLDMLAIRQTIEFLETAKKKYGFLSAIVLTMIIPSETEHKNFREQLAFYNVPIFKAEIKNRVAYRRALYSTGYVLDDDGSKAQEEIQNLAEEILNLVSKS